MTDNVDNWLADLDSTPPSAVDIAVHFAGPPDGSEWSHAARVAILTVSKLALGLDAARRAERAHSLMYAAAMRDAAQTAYLAVDRLSKLQSLIDAAYSGDSAALARESRKLREART